MARQPAPGAMTDGTVPRGVVTDDDGLLRILVTLTRLDENEAALLLASATPDGSTLRELVGLVRQAPATHDDRLALLTLIEETVPGPWTLVGGLAVMLHCIEHGRTGHAGHGRR
ncbi:hypothetical protein [Isoptericola sp. NPDC056605]|uniref:hypothetical protein n=1 Tax=Isoptericola sp. NPDC056605 TaxID=3345876 RepID=UPI0036A30228